VIFISAHITHKVLCVEEGFYFFRLIISVAVGWAARLDGVAVPLEGGFAEWTTRFVCWWTGLV
jgi:hypothetical protein